MDVLNKVLNTCQDVYTELSSHVTSNDEAQNRGLRAALAKQKTDGKGKDDEVVGNSKRSRVPGSTPTIMKRQTVVPERKTIHHQVSEECITESVDPNDELHFKQLHRVMLTMILSDAEILTALRNNVLYDQIT